jgi:hypothetical protein
LFMLIGSFSSWLSAAGSVQAEDAAVGCILSAILFVGSTACALASRNFSRAK